MVVRLVAHGDLLLLDSSSEFAVHMETGAGSGQGAVLEDLAYVVEQARGRQHDGGRMESDGPPCLPHQFVTRLGLLLISVEHLLFEYLIHQL